MPMRLQRSLLFTLVLVASGFAVLPHTNAEEAGWITLFFGFALWPVAFIWAYLDVPSRKAGDA